MIQNKCLLLSLVITASCTTPKPPATTSEWVNLAEVGSATCEPWPMAEKDMEVRALVPVLNRGKANGFVASVRQRNSSLEHVFVPATLKMEVDSDHAQILPLGQGSVLVGAWQSGAVPMLIVAHNSGSRATLELRKATDNRVLTRSTFVLDGNVRDAIIEIDGETVWMTLRTGDSSTVFAKLFYKGQNSQFERISFASESRGATLVVDQEKHSPYVVEAQPVADKINFKVTPLRGKELTPGPSQNIEMDAKGGIESWTVTSARGGFYFAAVTGDSMVGQGVMHAGIVGMRQQVPNWGWRKDLGLPDVHVSEPVWIASSNGPILTVMKWLDGEATMATFRATSTGLDIRKDRGVHPKGSIVVNGTEATVGTLVTVVRNRVEDLWRYNICKSSI